VRRLVSSWCRVGSDRCHGSLQIRLLGPSRTASLVQCVEALNLQGLGTETLEADYGDRDISLPQPRTVKQLAAAAAQRPPQSVHPAELQCTRTAQSVTPLTFKLHQPPEHTQLH
jgi:hypothetical protein